MGEVDGFHAIGCPYRQAVGGSELGNSSHCAHFALLGHAGDALAERTDGFFLVRAQLIQIDFDGAEVQTDVGHVLDFFDDIGGVQQRFRGDATDIEADAAELRVALDQNHVHAQVGGTECGGITTRTGTNDYQLAAVIGIVFRRRCGFGFGRRDSRCC